MTLDDWSELLGRALMRAGAACCWILAGMNLGMMSPENVQDPAWWKVALACVMALICGAGARMGVIPRGGAE